MDQRESASNPDALAPEDAFFLLANETRARIIQELGAAWSTEWPGLVSYSDLMEGVSADDSGRFNYHLSKLVGRYVIDKDDGYKLNFPGLRIYRSIVAGTFTENVTLDSFSIDGSCFDCQSSLQATYTDTIVSIRCSDCNKRYGEHSLPPRGAATRSNDDLLVAADQRTRHQQSQFLQGICPWCGSEPVTRIETPETSELSTWADTLYDVHVIHHCEDCGGLSGHSIGMRLLTHPRVISYYYDHGLDITSVPSWNLELAVTDHFTEVIAKDPWRFTVTIPLKNTTLDIILNESLDIVQSSLHEQPISK